jgi:hypothetical protein
MKRMIFLLMTLFGFLWLFTSCSFMGPEKRLEGDIMAYTATYNLQVVNNADSAVTVYGPGPFYQSGTYTAIFNVNEILRIESDGETLAEFTWNPKYTLYYSDNPDVPDPTAEEIKANFQPSFHSFYFKLVFEGGEEVYIVGWPKDIELPAEVKDEWDIIIPREKIKLYGFGYAEEKEVRIKEYDGREDSFAYTPFIIKGAASKDYDFDDAINVYGNAVLTIKSANDIRFETLNVSADPVE